MCIKIDTYIAHVYTYMHICIHNNVMVYIHTCISVYMEVIYIHAHMMIIYTYQQRYIHGTGLCTYTSCVCLVYVHTHTYMYIHIRIGRHPAVGSGAMTHEELAELIAKGEEVKGDEKPRRRHDEAQYTVHPKENPIR